MLLMLVLLLHFSVQSWWDTETFNRVYLVVFLTSAPLSGTYTVWLRCHCYFVCSSQAAFLKKKSDPYEVTILSVPSSICVYPLIDFETISTSI
jgi:hypothetical protein